MQNRLAERWQVNKYLWMCLLFVGVYLPVANAHGRLTVPLPLAYALFSLAVLNGALRTYIGWRRGGYNDERGWLFTLIDVLFISLGVYVTRGLQSDLWLFYFVLLISETLYATPGQARTLIALTISGYLAAAWPKAATPDSLLTLAARLFFLFLVGAFARRLSADRDRRNREVMLLHEQIAASEERARIAREIHDSLGHALVAGILRLELCARLIKRDPEEAERILQEEIPALRAAWNEGRNLAFHLRPWEWDEAGLAATLRRHVSRFAERTGLAVDLEMEEEDWGLAPETQLALMRILQEALTNVAKHAQAARVSIRVQRQGDEIRCVVQDNGIGFVPDARNGSFGLNAMRERAEELGGRFTLSSRPDSGTTVEAVLPAKR